MYTRTPQLRAGPGLELGMTFSWLWSSERAEAMRADARAMEAEAAGVELAITVEVGLVQRLRHALSHLADAVAGIASGRLPPRDEWIFTEDSGSMVVSGHLAMREDAVELVADITFTHWTGRHGGWATRPQPYGPGHDGRCRGVPGR